MKIVKRANVDDSHLQHHIANPVLRQLLARRGINQPEDLDTSLRGLLHFDKLQDIHIAADIIAQAIINKDMTMVAGDYDIDGMSGTALGLRCLRAFGLPEERLMYYIPSRYDDGYGLSKRAVDKAIERGTKLIITVDNGVAAFDSIDYANSHNIKVVVTDHHEVQDRIPNAAAVVDPKRADDQFASKNLCGVAVLFYVLSAVRSRLVDYGYYKSRQDAPVMAQFLDLVTLGTIGDLMPLDSNNRRFVKAGLNRIKNAECCLGLLALMRTIKCDPSKVVLRTISFEFAPRYNAAGRLKMSGNPAIDNLIADDVYSATSSAEKLVLCNKRRMDHEKVMVAKGLYQIEKLFDPENTAKVDPNERVSELLANNTASTISASSPAMANVHGIVLFDPTFLSGLVGLVATRIKDRFNKPCIVFGASVGAGQDSMGELFKQKQNNADVSAFIQPDGSGVNVASAQPKNRFQLATQYVPQEPVPQAMGQVVNQPVNLYPPMASMNSQMGNTNLPMGNQNQAMNYSSPMNGANGFNNANSFNGANTTNGGFVGFGAEANTAYNGGSVDANGFAYWNGTGNRIGAGSGMGAIAGYNLGAEAIANTGNVAGVGAGANGYGMSGSQLFTNPAMGNQARPVNALNNVYPDNTRLFAGSTAPNSAASSGYVNRYRLELAAYQNENSFLKPVFATSTQSRISSGFERIVTTQPSLEEVLEDTEKTFADPNCQIVVTGSARSVEGVDMMQVFNYIKQKAPDIFEKSGGHAMAAGASIKACNIPLFRQLFDEACAAVCTKDQKEEEALISDGALPPNYLSLSFARDLETFGPWGQDYEEPKFDGVFRLESAQMTSNNLHLRMKLRTLNGLIVVDGIKFKAKAAEKELVNCINKPVHVFYSMSIDRYYQERLQLNIEAIEEVSEEDAQKEYILQQNGYAG